MIRPEVGKEYVFLGARYIWRGRVVRLDEPFVELCRATQVIGHGATEIREELAFEPEAVVVINLQAVEAWWLESACHWVPNGR